MNHYSRSRRWASRSTRPVANGPDPYDPGSSRFAERHRKTETELPGGLVRVDVGEPVSRLPSEGLRSKAVEAEPIPAPADPAPDPLPRTEPRPVNPPRPRRDPWGLNRDEF